VATETERRAQELGNAMLNRDAARPYMDVDLDRQGLPVAVTPRDFFAFLEAVTTYNNRTPAMKDKALVLEGMSSRVIDFCKAFPSLRLKPQEEEDEDEQPLLEYDSEWDPKTEAGREKCLEYNTSQCIQVSQGVVTREILGIHPPRSRPAGSCRHCVVCCCRLRMDLTTNAIGFLMAYPGRWVDLVRLHSRRGPA
jgi:hypothetical protein